MEPQSCTTYPPLKLTAMENGPGLKMYFLLRMGIFHLFHCYQRVFKKKNVKKNNKKNTWWTCPHLSSLGLLAASTHRSVLPAQQHAGHNEVQQGTASAGIAKTSWMEDIMKGTKKYEVMIYDTNTNCVRFHFGTFISGKTSHYQNYPQKHI